MARLIDQDNIIKLIERDKTAILKQMEVLKELKVKGTEDYAKGVEVTCNDIIKQIKKMKDEDFVDAVQVVRCKDCMFAYKDKDGELTCDLNYYYNGLHQVTRPDSYCSDGERKKGEHDE